MTDGPGWRWPAWGARSQSDAVGIRPFDGAVDLLSRLKDRGDRVAIWTSRDLASAALVLKHSGLDRFVQKCVSGTCVMEHTPHPEGLLRILGEYGCPPEDAVMVGDHENDMRAARQAGTYAIRASWNPHGETTPCVHAHQQFRRIADLKTWLG